MFLGTSGIVLLGAAGANKVATWIMIQGLQNNLYSYNTRPQILPLPNGTTATLTSYQVKQTGNYDAPCMTVIDSSGVVKDAGQSFTGANGSTAYLTLYNNGTDNIIYYGSGYNTAGYYATYNGATYGYSSSTVRYGDNGINNQNFAYGRTKPGYYSCGVGYGSGYVNVFSGTSFVIHDTGINTTTWGTLAYRGQIDVDASNNPSYVATSTAGNIIYGRKTASSYTAYSFSGASGTIGNYNVFLCINSSNTAFIANMASATETRVHVISSAPAMTSRVSFTYSSGALSPYYIAHDPDDTTKAYMLFTTTTNTQLALVKFTVSTGVIDYQKVFTFGAAVDTNSLQLLVYGGYVYIAGKSTNVGASIAPIAFYMKLDKTTITNGTYNTTGISSTYGTVTVGTLGVAITPSVLSNLSLTSNATTGSVVDTTNMTLSTSGLVPFFYNQTSTGV